MPRRPTLLALAAALALALSGAGALALAPLGVWVGMWVVGGRRA